MCAGFAAPLQPVATSATDIVREQPCTAEGGSGAKRKRATDGKDEELEQRFGQRRRHVLGPTYDRDQHHQVGNHPSASQQRITPQ